MNRKESALVCILFFIYPSEDIVYIWGQRIFLVGKLSFKRIA